MSRPVLAMLGAVLVLAALPAGAALAAAPANDDFADAAVLGLDAPVSGANVDATAEEDEPLVSAATPVAFGCATATAAPHCMPSVWYRFTPAADGAYVIETCDASTELDTVVAVYSGTSVGALTEIVSNDDGEAECAGGFDTNGSRVAVAATAGTEYAVQVNGYTGRQGGFWLRAYALGNPPAPPAVDTRTERSTSVAYAAALDDRGPGLFSGPRRTPSFGFSSTIDGATFECSLDGAAYAACASPLSLDGVTGAHELRARGVKAGVRDATPLVLRFSIDRAAPDTTITGPEGTTADTTAEWTAVSTEPLFEETFRCAVDAVPAGDLCGAITAVASLCKGAHTFRSAAIDRAGNVDPTPAERTVTVTSGEDCAPPGLSAHSTASGATVEDVGFSVDTHGAGLRFHVEYGKTTAYGERTETVYLLPDGFPISPSQSIEGLEPATLYHYRVVTATPFGTVASEDRTFTTDAAPGELPVLEVGAPVATGRHAARIPVELETQGDAMRLGLLVETGAGAPVTLDSPLVDVDDGDSSDEAGPRRIDLTDLEPGTTYRFRVLATGNESVLSAERSFTVPDGTGPVDPGPAGPGPPPPPPPGPPPPAFALGKGDVGVRSLSRRRAKAIRIVVRNLPPGTAVRASAKVRRKALGSARGTAGADGVSKLAIKLSAKKRRLLRKPKVKRVTIRVVATPPGQARSSVSRTVKLKP